MKRHRIIGTASPLASYVLLAGLAVACGPSGGSGGDAEQQSDAGTAAICEPIDASEVDDCALPEDDLLIDTAEDLARICESRCSRVEGGLSIRRIAGLRDLSPLKNLTYVERLSIGSMPDLESLEGLEQLQGALWLGLDRNPRLRSIEALAGLEELDSFAIRENPSLESLRGLHNVGHLNGGRRTNEAWVTRNNALVNLEGLEGLVTSDATIIISHNEALMSTEGLHNLERAQALHLRQNHRLTKLRLDSLKEVGWLVIDSNSSLDQCEIDPVVEQVEATEDVKVMENATATCE